MRSYRPIRAQMNAGALLRNYRALESLCGESRLLSVLKADAYGHGAVKVASILEKDSETTGAKTAFGVCSLDEALILRRGGITSPILLMSQPLDESVLKLCETWSLMPMLYQEEDIQVLLQSQFSDSLPVWVKFDSGMNRLGLNPEALQACWESLKSRFSLVLTSHLHSADSNPMSAHEQCDRFIAMAHCIDAEFVSLCNSAGVGLSIHQRLKAALPHAHQWVRVGYSLYGARFGGDFVEPSLSPVMCFEAQVLQIRSIQKDEGVSYGKLYQVKKDTKIAVISAGYADGIPWIHGSCQFFASFQEKRFPVIGSVCMDLLHIEVGDDPISVGDWVEFWGVQNPIETVAKEARTTPYVLWTTLNKRVSRIWSL